MKQKNQRVICGCGVEVPSVRVGMGYRECVGCSSVERVGVVDVVNHKTGNEVEVVDAEVAGRVNRMSRRKGFGTMACMGERKSSTYNPKGLRYGVSEVFVGSEVGYERVGERCMGLYEVGGIEGVYGELDRAIRDYEISGMQAGRLRRVFQALELGKGISDTVKQVDYRGGKESGNTVGKDDVEWVFRNWAR